MRDTLKRRALEFHQSLRCQDRHRITFFLVFRFFSKIFVIFCNFHFFKIFLKFKNFFFNFLNFQFFREIENYPIISGIPLSKRIILPCLAGRPPHKLFPTGFQLFVLRCKGFLASLKFSLKKIF